MRLADLFEEFIVEAPGDEALNTEQTITFSLADMYDSMNIRYPKKMGPNGRLITPPGFFEQKTMKVGGEDGISPDIASALSQHKAGGGVPGMIMRDNELRPYNDNHVLEDLSWKFLAGATELASQWTKFGAVAIDDYINNFTSHGRIHKYMTGKDLSNLKTTTLSGYKDKDKQFILDSWSKYLDEQTDQAFRDNVEATAGAVDSIEDVASLFMGLTKFNLEGMAGIMIGELPSEIVDVALVIGTGGIGGLAATGVLNAAEAGGAAAQSITDRINQAHDKNLLQTTPQYIMYFDAAKEQLSNDGVNRTKDELLKEADNLARQQAIYGAIKHSMYKIALVGGTIDMVQNKVLYGGPIKIPFMRNAVTRGVIGTLGEGVSGAMEQYLENGGIRSQGKTLSTKTEGVVNAAYVEMLAGQTANVVGGTVGAVRSTNAAFARFRQFIVGGRKDPRAVIDIMSMDPNELARAVNKVDENGNRRFAMADLVNARLPTSDMVERGTRPDKRGRYTVKTEDGVTHTVTMKELKENDRKVRVVELFDDLEISDDEGTATVNLGSEAEVRELAAYFGYPKSDTAKLNTILADLERIRKIDVRVKGREELEPPVWSDLTDQQQMQYWKEGRVTFQGHPERGNQEWTRGQILFNSRQTGDTIPEEIANLGDNVDARPVLTAQQQRELDEARGIINNNAMLRIAQENLADDQAAWDEVFAQTHNADGSPKDPNAEGIAGRQLTADDTFTWTNGARPTEELAKADPNDNVGFTKAQASTSNLQTRVDQILRMQKIWDQRFSKTHTDDGAIRGGQDILDKIRESKLKQEAETARKEKIEELKNDEDLQVEVQEKPTIPSTDNNDPIRRGNVIAGTKIKIANADMEPDAVDKLLNNLEQTYPGIRQEIMTEEQFDNYQKVDLRPQVQDEVGNNETVEEPEAEQINDRPPEGAVVELDGQPYVWLGVTDGVGGMWAIQKPDGTRGSTNHPNHQELNGLWRESIGEEAQATPEKPSQLEQDPMPTIEDFESAPPEVQVEIAKPEGTEGDELELNVDTSDKLKPTDITISTVTLGDPPPADAAPELDTDPPEQSTIADPEPRDAEQPQDQEGGVADFDTDAGIDAEPQDQEGGVGGQDGELADITGDTVEPATQSDADAEMRNDIAVFNDKASEEEKQTNPQNKPSTILTKKDTSAVDNQTSADAAQDAGSADFTDTTDPADQQDDDTLDAMGDTELEPADQSDADIAMGDPADFGPTDAEIKQQAQDRLDKIKKDAEAAAAADQQDDETLDAMGDETPQDPPEVSTVAPTQPDDPTTDQIDTPKIEPSSPPPEIEKPDELQQPDDAEEIPPEVQKAIDGADNSNLLPNTDKITEPNANKPVEFVPIEKLPKDARDAITKSAQDNQDSADDAMDKADSETDSGDTTTDTNTDTKTDTETDTKTDTDKDDNQAQDLAQTNKDALDQTDTINPTDVPPIVKPNLNVTTQKKNKLDTTKSTDSSKKKRDKVGKGKPDEEDDTDYSELMKFAPAKFADPLDLDKYKGAMGRSQRKI